MKGKAVWKKSSHFGMVLCLLILAVIIGSPETSPASETPTTNKTNSPQYGGVLKIGVSGSSSSGANPIGYPPQMLKGVLQRNTAPAIETLLRCDQSGKLTPWLAEEFIENAQDKTIALKLRKGVKFHDGTAFNAEAVKWNFPTFLDCLIWNGTTSHLVSV